MMTAINAHRSAAEKAYRIAAAALEEWRANLVAPPPPSQVGATLVGLFTLEVNPEFQAFSDPQHWATLGTNLSRAMTLGTAVEAVKFLGEHDPAALAQLPNRGRDFKAAADRAAQSLTKRPTDPSVASSPDVAVPWGSVAAIIRALHMAVARMQCEFLELPDAIR